MQGIYLYALCMAHLADCAWLANLVECGVQLNLSDTGPVLAAFCILSKDSNLAQQRHEGHADAQGEGELWNGRARSKLAACCW